MWKEKLSDIIAPMGIDINIQGKTVIFTCPRELDRKEQALLISNIPTQFDYKFEVNYKSATIKALYSLIVPSLMGNLTHRVISDKINLYIDSNLNLDDINWVKVKKIINKDGFFKSWEVSVNGNPYKPSLLSDEIAKNNRIREKIINNDDITNLRIILHTSRTLDEFIKRI